MPVTPELFLTIQDGKGKKTNMTLPLPIPGTTSAANVFSAARNWAEAIQDAISGKIVRAGVALIADLGGLGIPAAPDPNSDVEEGALWSFLSADGFRTQFRIPTFKEELFVEGTTIVDMTDTVNDAIMDRVIDGIEYAVGQDLDPSTNHGEDITAFEYARSAFRRERG